MAEELKLIPDIHLGRAVRDLRTFQYHAVYLDVNGRVDLHTANSSAAPYLLNIVGNSGQNVSACHPVGGVGKGKAAAALAGHNYVCVTGSGGWLGVGSDASPLLVGQTFQAPATSIGSGDTFSVLLR